MADFIKSNYIMEEKVKLKEIPAIIFRPRDAKEPIPTVVFYHGWSSNKETQRMRGFILASVGYQVVIPDAIYHGERIPLADYSREAAIEYFWDVVFKNVEEYSIIKNELVSKHAADSNRIAIMGNSMGGFTAGGIFTHNKDIRALIVLNGCCWWENFNRNADVTEKFERVEERVKELDPMNHLELLTDRPILLLHGDSDTSVPIESQNIFYNKLSYMYKNKERIRLIEYHNLNHFVTTNMMEESINWLGRYL
ncbi:MAG: prolyl oligopeptidase family serine peptidase [Tissierellia bacterium]|nr:prolyl oligopeptidase family serine peptidase [Tissierellia bacterium]